ncbi:MAG: FadR/GntR family transcriptional regulator [Planctomycetota bacterium]|jgi:GntR family transcriptional repressor for pyruvate dehydrogenase complex
MNLKKINTVSQPTKVDQAVSALEEHIVSGIITTGSFLPSESELAKQLGVSKFCMREALRVLHVRGLIEISQGKRTRVINTSAKSAVEMISLVMRRSEMNLADLVEVRMTLECDIARHAALRATDKHIERMQESIDRIEENRDDHTLCRDSDMEFHKILIEAAGNKIYEVVLAPLAGELRKWQIDNIKKRFAVDEAVKGHNLILDAVKKREPELAAEKMKRHIAVSADLYSGNYNYQSIETG